MSELLFFIAILPDAPIQKEITDFKKYLAEHFDASHALKSPPHITLFPPFKWQPDQVDTLVAALDNFATERQRFSLSLKNFNSFPPRVIFVDVEKSQALQLLQKQLETYLETELNLKNERSHPHFNPHMTIAHKDLKRDNYPIAWAHFANQTYHRTFLVQAITLLQYRRGRWEEFEYFSLYA